MFWFGKACSGEGGVMSWFGKACSPPEVGLGLEKARLGRHGSESAAIFHIPCRKAAQGEAGAGSRGGRNPKSAAEEQLARP